MHLCLFSGGEWDYVVMSLVRSLPDYRIEPKPTLGWCKQNLGFITDENQTNVALTRARKGLIIKDSTVQALNEFLKKGDGKLVIVCFNRNTTKE